LTVAPRVEALFPTRIYVASLSSRGGGLLNDELLHECRQLRRDDPGGVRWSLKHYPNGYTSYNSANRMHTVSPTFALLQRRLDRHVAKFVDLLEFEMRGRVLSMTDCWVNIMHRGAVHGSHLHPLATLSGIYYVQTPRNGPGLKFEDPRLDRMMAAPPRRSAASRENQTWVTVPVQPGQIILFESWLRHEVAPNPARGDRISISFNYGWF
jgi:uncharacterized protein (TIGR02466 family)